MTGPSMLWYPLSVWAVTAATRGGYGICRADGADLERSSRVQTVLTCVNTVAFAFVFGNAAIHGTSASEAGEFGPADLAVGMLAIAGLAFVASGLLKLKVCADSGSYPSRYHEQAACHLNLGAALVIPSALDASLWTACVPTT